MISLWKSALDKMLRTQIRQGALRVVLPDGTARDYGSDTGSDTGSAGSSPPLTLRLHDAATVRRLVLIPELALGEAYMNGTLTIDGDDLQGFLALIIRNARIGSENRVWWQRPLRKARAVLRGAAHNNIASRSRRNVAHHYDLSGRLYDLFLDADRQYSCAYFKDPGDTLEVAQAQKKEHIARKLMIAPEMRVLDIGCGWGGMALTLARDYGAQVLGITLSREQHAFAVERARREGLSDRVEFRLCDYRDVTGSFERIVSVGMFEHVGLRHFDTYFKTLRDLLTPEGIALVHTIGWTAEPAGTNPWIAKYIFPGGYIPTVSEAMAGVEKAHLWATDIECWRMHYAYTLRHWYDRFEANEATVREIYDARFVRMWRMYLAASEQTFRHSHQAVFQFQLTREIDAVPLTRDYLYTRPAQIQSLHTSERLQRPRRRSGSDITPLTEHRNDQQTPSRH